MELKKKIKGLQEYICAHFQQQVVIIGVSALLFFSTFFLATYLVRSWTSNLSGERGSFPSLVSSTAAVAHHLAAESATLSRDYTSRELFSIRSAATDRAVTKLVEEYIACKIDHTSFNLLDVVGIERLTRLRHQAAYLPEHVSVSGYDKAQSRIVQHTLHSTRVVLTHNEVAVLTYSLHIALRPSVTILHILIQDLSLKGRFDNIQTYKFALDHMLMVDELCSLMLPLLPPEEQVLLSALVESTTWKNMLYQLRLMLVTAVTYPLSTHEVLYNSNMSLRYTDILFKDVIQHVDKDILHEGTIESGRQLMVPTWTCGTFLGAASLAVLYILRILWASRRSHAQQDQLDEKKSVEKKRKFKTEAKSGATSAAAHKHRRFRKLRAIFRIKKRRKLPLHITTSVLLCLSLALLGTLGIFFIRITWLELQWYNDTGSVKGYLKDCKAVVDQMCFELEAAYKWRLETTGLDTPQLTLRDVFMKTDDLLIAINSKYKPDRPQVAVAEMKLARQTIALNIATSVMAGNYSNLITQQLRSMMSKVSPTIPLTINAITLLQSTSYMQAVYNLIHTVRLGVVNDTIGPTPTKALFNDFSNNKRVHKPERNDLLLYLLAYSRYRADLFLLKLVMGREQEVQLETSQLQESYSIYTSTLKDVFDTIRFREFEGNPKIYVGDPMDVTVWLNDLHTISDDFLTMLFDNTKLNNNSKTWFVVYLIANLLLVVLFMWVGFMSMQKHLLYLKEKNSVSSVITELPEGLSSRVGPLTNLPMDNFGIPEWQEHIHARPPSEYGIVENPLNSLHHGSVSHSQTNGTTTTPAEQPIEPQQPPVVENGTTEPTDSLPQSPSQQALQPIPAPATTPAPPPASTPGSTAEAAATPAPSLMMGGGCPIMRAQ